MLDIKIEENLTWINENIYTIQQILWTMQNARRTKLSLGEILLIKNQKIFGCWASYLFNWKYERFVG